MPHQDDPVGVEALLGGMGAKPGDGACDIGRLLLDRRPGDEAVVDRGEGPATGGEMDRLGALGLALVADRPAAAVEEQHDGRAGRVCGFEQVEFLQWVGAVGQFNQPGGFRCAGGRAVADRLAAVVAQLGQGGH